MSREQMSTRNEMEDVVTDKEAGLKRLPDAGKLYSEAARLQEINLRLYKESLNNYEKAARCYRKANYRKAAIDCYRKIIDVLLKDNKIDRAIQRCFKYGYKCKELFCNMEKMEEFYKRGKELRLRHKISHTCSITTFDEYKYQYNLPKAKEDYERV
ncbi:hypothetical protein RF11_05904 [Thelohanellus kitauei]|uniref:Uncharacterized protein n=1 Tax=Thelohanellus kitauei TaxID=669202 RepID=A0A0C2MRD0_THEKT|nr:hypothetical protein RF11_05904 [Thelohanellus kitauei]